MSNVELSASLCECLVTLTARRNTSFVYVRPRRLAITAPVFISFCVCAFDRKRKQWDILCFFSIMGACFCLKSAFRKDYTFDCCFTPKCSELPTTEVGFKILIMFIYYFWKILIGWQVKSILHCSMIKQNKCQMTDEVIIIIYNSCKDIK